MLLNVMFVLATVLTPSSAYNQGNALYAQRDYAHAAAAYEQALAAGPNANAHYNLANALFKAGKITLEEALSNADSRTNLEARINFG